MKKTSLMGIALAILSFSACCFEAKRDHGGTVKILRPDGTDFLLAADFSKMTVCAVEGSLETCDSTDASGNRIFKEIDAADPAKSFGGLDFRLICSNAITILLKTEGKKTDTLLFTSDGCCKSDGPSAQFNGQNCPFENGFFIAIKN